MASHSTGGWLAKINNRETLPLVVALQGLGFCLLAFFLTAPPSQPGPDGSVAEATRLQDQQPVRLTETQIPADLHPEQLRLPRFPDPKERTLQRQATRSSEERGESPYADGILDGLHIDTMAIRAPAVSQVALALPDAPTQLAPGTISLRRFGEGSGRPGRDGMRGVGFGGIGGGYGGVGMGDGGRCHPQRPGFLRDPRNPVTSLPPVIERAVGYPQ
jgi:hypothetical protein